MPRLPRKISKTGIYHVMLRGINKQDIFLDKQDKYKFLKELELTKEKYQYELYAYCLMPNHVHLLIALRDETIGKVMQSINIRYSIYFNSKYKRVGHLFQNRFLSKPVENDRYLLHLQRYIHQNPLKAKLSSVERYKWSSYQEYIKQSKIIETDFILNLFDTNNDEAIKKFIKYNHEIYPSKMEEEIEYEFKNILSDEELVEMIKERLGISDIEEMKKYNKTIRDKMIQDILKIKCVRENQVARVCGITRKMIQRVKDNK